MAEGRMMTPADVVARAMAGEHGDLLRDAVALVVRELMDAEVATLTVAGRRAPGVRPSASRTSTGTASGRGRQGLARSSWRSRGRGRDRRTSPASWSPGGAASRRSSRW